MMAGRAGIRAYVALVATGGVLATVALAGRGVTDLITGDTFSWGLGNFVRLDALNEPVEANLAYLGVFSTYAGYYDWVTQAWERYIVNSLADFEKMELNDPLSIALKRQKELTLYKLSLKNIYQWQKLDEEKDAPSGALTRLRRDIVEMKEDLNILPLEEQQILRELGIAPTN